MTWVKALKVPVEDPGVVFRCLWCSRCNSIRYHKVMRLKITKVNTEWWAFYSKKCNGIPPTIEGKWPKVIRTCNYETREWLIASQWNWLVRVNAYAA